MVDTGVLGVDGDKNNVRSAQLVAPEPLDGTRDDGAVWVAGQGDGVAGSSLVMV